MLVALLVAAVVASVVLAVVQTVRLGAALNRIDELEGRTGATAEEEEEDGGLLDGLLEGILGEEEGLLGCVDGDLLVGPRLEAPSGQLRAQVRTIAGQVEEIRELEFRESVEPELLSAAQVRERIGELLLEEYTAEIADAEARLLAALGAIPRGTDLRDLRAEILGQQVAGYYVPETGEMVVRAEGDPGPLEWTTLAHELQHALADQVLGLPVPDEIRTGTEDRDLAGVAVVEGDATLTQQRYALSLPPEHQLAFLDPSAIAEARAGLGGLPHFLRRELLFPYEEGLEFVCQLYRAGGWTAVDGAYREPPTTTAQVLFPDRYAAGDQAVFPRGPGRPGEGWRRATVHEVGAATLLWLFEAPGDDRSRALEDPRAAAGEWAGGQMHLWTRGPDTALGLSLVDREGGERLCDAVTDWYREAFSEGEEAPLRDGEELALRGGGQTGVVACPGDEVRVGIGPDLATARRQAA